MENSKSILRKSVLVQFGQVVERIRYNTQKNTYRLSEETGITVDTISAVEIGEEWPGDAAREAICCALGLSVDTFPKMLRTAMRNIQSSDEPEINSIGIKPTFNTVVQLSDYRK